jgi:TRAP-type transport system small permease protein
MIKMILDKIFWFVDFFCNLLLLLLIPLVCYIVFARFILNNPPAWGEELALLCMIWFCLIGPSLALREDRHLCINIVQHLIPGIAMKVIDIFNNILIVGFSVFMIKEGAALAVLTTRNVLPGSGLSTSVMYVSIPIAGAFMLIAAIECIVRIARIPAKEYKAKLCKA